MVSWPQEEGAFFDQTIGGRAPGTLSRPVIPVGAPLCSGEGPCPCQNPLTHPRAGLSPGTETLFIEGGSIWVCEDGNVIRTQCPGIAYLINVRVLFWTLFKTLLVLLGHYKPFRTCYNPIWVLLVLTISQEEEFFFVTVSEEKKSLSLSPHLFEGLAHVAAAPKLLLT